MKKMMRNAVGGLLMLGILLSAGCGRVQQTSAAADRVEVRNNGTAIQWKYSDETDWRDLAALTELYGADGKDGTDVEHVDTQGQGSLARWHLAAGQYLNELTGGTGGIFGRDHPHLHLFAIDHGLHRGDRLGLVILNGDEDQPGFEDMADDVDPFGDALGLFAHQTVITADVGFTLGAIDDQDLDLLAASCQFDVGRETGAPQTDDACLMNAAHQIQWTPFAVVRPWKTLAPFIETVGLDMDTQLTQS